MPIFTRVLVAVDGSPASLHALQEVSRLPGASLLLAAVAPRGKATAPGPGLEGAPQPWAKALAAASRLAAEGGREAESLLLSGEPHEALLAAARSRGADLIVVGLKGRDLTPAALMGSTTARTIGFSPVDVLVVPEHGRLGFSRVVLPLDGSRYSEAAASRALELCEALGAELEAVAGLDVPPGFGAEVPEVAQALGQRLKELVALVCRRAESRGITCRGTVAEGAAWRVVVDAARESRAGLIVMGSHGRTGLRRLLMGSVTERVVGLAPCPVLVVKGKSGAPAEEEACPLD